MHRRTNDSSSEHTRVYTNLSNVPMSPAVRWRISEITTEILFFVSRNHCIVVDKRTAGNGRLGQTGRRHKNTTRQDTASQTSGSSIVRYGVAFLIHFCSVFTVCTLSVPNTTKFRKRLDWFAWPYDRLSERTKAFTFC